MLIGAADILPYFLLILAAFVFNSLIIFITWAIVLVILCDTFIPTVVREDFKLRHYRDAGWILKEFSMIGPAVDESGVLSPLSEKTP